MNKSKKPIDTLINNVNSILHGTRFEIHIEQSEFDGNLMFCIDWKDTFESYPLSFDNDCVSNDTPIVEVGRITHEIIRQIEQKVGELIFK